MEQGIVMSESSLPFRAIPAAAVRGRNPITLLHTATTLAAGVLAATALLRELRPAAILGTGGYVCVPLFLAARATHIPTLIYLPDVVPGLAVQMLTRIATQTACSVPASRRSLPHAEVTGYPVRETLFQQDKAACRARFRLGDDLPVLLIYGGSRGARSINRAVEALLPDILALAQVIHICGREGDEAWLTAAAARLDSTLRARYRLYPYLASSAAGYNTTSERSTPANNEHELTPEHAPSAPGNDRPDMVQAFGAADVALCRSGASVMAELPAAGLPAVLVPYPYVHQDENADYLVQHGAAVKVADTEMLGSTTPQAGPLFTHLQRLLTGTAERQQMSACSRALARPDAARRLAHALLALTMTRR
jgi:UDP-N-acetylglucosamine--N-acetylmuramyl-(pentapeptide) pyrophosphoryl-undecaprenol N-acetylglucosamine transferase